MNNNDKNSSTVNPANIRVIELLYKSYLSPTSTQIGGSKFQSSMSNDYPLSLTINFNNLPFVNLMTALNSNNQIIPKEI